MGYSARKLLEEFLDKDWSCSALDRLLQQIDAATGSAGRKSVSSRERTVCTRDMQMSVQMMTTLSTNCNWWYYVRTAKATFPYWKLLFLSSIFSERELNSDKICGSYCDFYFGVTFFGTHCIHCIAVYVFILYCAIWSYNHKI